MKIVKRSIRCWTDYPKEGEKYSGQIRHVLVLRYDGDKYATVKDLGDPTAPYQDIKIGYLFSNRSTYKTAKVVNPDKIRRKFGYPTFACYMKKHGYRRVGRKGWWTV
jgi:hypothetical protein